jgi:histidinol-phosphatase (PHP family)
MANRKEMVTMSKNVFLREVIVLLDITGDYHMHTTYSDGAASVEAMGLAAIEKGLRTIAITDHMPLPFATRYALARTEMDHYRREITAAKRLFGDQLAIKMGLEIEYISAHSGWIREIVALGWDHLIVSIHHLPGQNGLHLINGHEKEFMPLFAEFRTDPAGLCHHYYRTLQEAIATGLFSCVGHLDVLKKWNTTFGHIDENAAWYRSLILETLDVMQRHGTMLEINTAGWNQPPSRQYPSDWIIVAANQRSIPIVMGSDSHSPQTIGQYFSRMKDRFHH